MFDLGTPETLWTLTNQCIAAVVVISGIVVARDVVRHLQLQFQRREQRVRVDDHSFFVPELGLTMADGGERTDGPAEAGAARTAPPAAAAPPSRPAEK